MGKLILLIIILAGLYYIGTNYKSIDIEATKNAVIQTIETKGAIGKVRDGRAKRQKEILDATSF